MMKDIYDTREAARELGMSTFAIRYAINSKRLKATKFGKSFVIQKKDLEEYAKYRKEKKLDE